MDGIQRYRVLQGLTQAELAEKLGVSQGAVGNWESGIRKPDVYMLKKIAETLNCTADDILATSDSVHVEIENT